VQLLFIIIAVLMVSLAVGLLCVGALSTGSTREEVYKRLSARKGGRIICIVVIVLAYAINILWMLALAATAILSFIYYIFSGLCSSLTSYSESNCLDFRLFQPLFKDITDAPLIFCGGNAQQFCALTNTVVTWYIVGFIGSLIVCLGLIQFIASNAANYAHLRSQNRYVELQQIVYAETAPNDIVGTPTYPTPSFAYNGTKKYPLAPPPQSFNQAYPMDSRHASGTVNARRNSYHNSIHGSSHWLNAQY
jgi:hypothetical protein